MKAKIIIITSQYLHGFVRDTLDEVKADCDIQILEYTNFYHAIQIYRDYEERADGFMISGKAAQMAITKALPGHKKPVLSFESSFVSEYRLLLELFLQERQLDSGRVLMDSLIPVFQDASVDSYLSCQPPYHIQNLIFDWLDRTTLEEISDLERQLSGKIIELWEKGEIDFVICHYGSIIPILEQHKIPYRYCGPTGEYICSILESLLSQIKLKRLHGNLTGVIAVSGFTDNGSSISGERMKEALIDIKNDFALDIVLQEEGGHYYIFTTLKVIEHITDKFRRCSVRFALKKQGIDAYVGYGIGENVMEAKGNARDALKEAVFSKGCFAVDEQHQMIGPLDAENYFGVKIDISDELFLTADRCKLSSLTIQKLLSIVEMTGTNRITQKNLAKHLGVTSRNAGRILGNLVKGGAASMVYTKSVTTKGRPVKVYELNLRT